MWIPYSLVKLESIHLRVCTEVSFATNDYLSLHSGYLIILSDKNNNANLSDFRSRRRFKIWRTGLFRDNQNTANLLSKLKGNKKLGHLIKTCRDDTRIFQWTDCSTAQSSAIDTEEKE